MNREAIGKIESWGLKSDPRHAAAHLNLSLEQMKAEEAPLEGMVSHYIGAMPFLWLAVEDEPGPGSDRSVVERNSIALLSNYGKSAVDPQSSGWLGGYCDRHKVCLSGLWNNNHVDEDYHPDFLARFENLLRN